MQYFKKEKVFSLNLIVIINDSLPFPAMISLLVLSMKNHIICRSCRIIKSVKILESDPSAEKARNIIKLWLKNPVLWISNYSP